MLTTRREEAYFVGYRPPTHRRVAGRFHSTLRNESQEASPSFLLMHERAGMKSSDSRHIDSHYGLVFPTYANPFRTENFARGFHNEMIKQITNNNNNGRLLYLSNGKMSKSCAIRGAALFVCALRASMQS